MIGEQYFDPPVEGQTAHGAGQQSERLEHTSDVVRQSCRHADELHPGAKQGARLMSVERLHVHRSIPPRAHDLRQSFRVILIGLVHLHLERGAGMPCVKADDIEASAA